ncbi:tyrosine-type recombinase/integrase [Cohnella abietis]|uniref:tyrosine-type recombinase/integrase n=1 Tax=Cohnella abietis TaxID=2507935 RepID=UPI00102E6FD7|nr:tyrosine-type recombinase/integrase [Cohnella abietis]
MHDLRHSSATLFIEAGASMKAKQERLGHKQKQTTDDIYVHVTKKVSRELASKFN